MKTINRRNVLKSLACTASCLLFARLVSNVHADAQHTVTRLIRAQIVKAPVHGGEVAYFKVLLQQGTKQGWVPLAGKPVVSQVKYLTVAGQANLTATTDAAGWATFAYVVPTNLPKITQRGFWSAQFTGDAAYHPDGAPAFQFAVIP